MLSIKDLPENQELDRQALADISGGYLDPSAFANVDIDILIDQDINQFQSVQVAALNNNGIIGADLGQLNLNVNPSLWAANYAGPGFGYPTAL